MLRFTSLALLVACVAPSHRPAPPPAPAPIAKAITRYELPPTQMRMMDGRHSSQHTRTSVSGSLELIGSGATTTARLAIDTVSQTSYVLCPNRRPWDGSSRQACVTEVPEGGDRPHHGSVVLAGTARWEGETLKVSVSKELQPDKARAPFTAQITLACTDEGGSLVCSVEEQQYMMALWGASELRFVRALRPHARAPQSAITARQ
jgi:hypothetical protein